MQGVVPHALDPTWAKKIGVDLENLLVSQPSCAEEALKIAEMLIKSNAVDMPASGARAAAPLLAGFAEADITPDLSAGTVFLAGFGQNRRATAVLDPIAVRAIVLRDGSQTIAIACADVVGLFLPSTQRIRKEFPSFGYVLVSSTHNHHAPRIAFQR